MTTSQANSFANFLLSWTSIWQNDEIKSSKFGIQVYILVCRYFIVRDVE